MVSIGSIVIRVDDLQRQIDFWSAALDYVSRSGLSEGDDFMLLRPRDGAGPNLSLDMVPAKVQVPPKIHLDLYTQDQAGEVERLIGLGATEVHWDKKPADADYVILADPRATASAWWTSPADRRSAADPASGRAAKPFEAIEDQVQAEGECPRLVRLALPHVLMHVLDEVGQVVDRQTGQERLRKVGQLRLVHLQLGGPQREPRDVALERVIRENPWSPPRSRLRAGNRGSRSCSASGPVGHRSSRG